MPIEQSDDDFLKRYLECLDVVSQHTPEMVYNVTNPACDTLLYKSVFAERFGATSAEIYKILSDDRLQQYRTKAIASRAVVKLLGIRSFPNVPTRMAIVTNLPLINPSTGNVVALLVNVHSIEVFNLSNILARYYRSSLSDLSNTLVEQIPLTERERQVVFFFLLNLDSQSIADIIAEIESKTISKNAIDQIFHKQLLPKFGVYSRKALYDKLNEYGFERVIPQNILRDGLILEITDYVIYC